MAETLLNLGVDPTQPIDDPRLGSVSTRVSGEILNPASEVESLDDLSALLITLPSRCPGGD